MRRGLRNNPRQGRTEKTVSILHEQKGRNVQTLIEDLKKCEGDITDNS